jgi:anti-sigma factor RsiW
MTPTDCSDIRGMLADYQAGLLGGRRRAEVEQHLAGCEACRAELRALEATAKVLDETEPLRPSRDLWPGIARQLTPRRRPQAWWHSLVPSSPRAAFALAAVVVLLVAVAIVFPIHSHHPLAPLPHAVDEDAPLFAQWHAQASIRSGLADPYALALVVLNEPSETGGGR